jgi:hypothetical protein
LGLDVNIFGFARNDDSSEVARLRAELIEERELSELLYKAVVSINDDSMAYLAIDAYARSRGGKIVGRQWFLDCAAFWNCEVLMAIGSSSPIGENFVSHGAMRLPNGSMDWVKWDAWSQEQAKLIAEGGLLHGYARIMYPPNYVPSWRRKAGYTETT